MKKIYLATDHAGFELKEKIKNFLEKKGFKIKDYGAFEYQKNDDFPDFIKPLAKQISKDFSNRCPNSLGIILGGSGQGEAMCANRFKNVRAIVYYSHDKKILQLSKEHNNANILSIAARFLDEKKIMSDIIF